MLELGLESGIDAYRSPIHKVTEPKEDGHANKYIRTQVVNTMVGTWVWKERWELINFMEVEVKVDEQRIRKRHLSWVLKYKSLPRLEAWDGYERRKGFWLRVDCHECISSSYNFPKITLTKHLSPKLSSQKCQDHLYTPSCQELGILQWQFKH